MKIETMSEFITLVKCHSFSKAARELFLSQPSLSTHIGAMEKELGFAVLERDHSKFALTPAGAAFLEHAQAIVGSYEEARDMGRLIAKEEPPIKMMGVEPGSALFRALSSLNDTKINFVEIEYNTTLLDALIDGIVDIGICADYTGVTASRKRAAEAHVSYVSTGLDRGALAVMRSHPLAQKASLSKSDIDGTTVSIGSYAHFDEWKHVVQEMIGEDIKLKFHLSPIESVADLAREDLGNMLHVCSRATVQQQSEQRDDVVVFDELDGKPIWYPSGIAYRADSTNHELPQFVDTLANLVKASRERA